MTPAEVVAESLDSLDRGGKVVFVAGEQNRALVQSK